MINNSILAMPYFLDQNLQVILISAFQNSGLYSKAGRVFEGDFY